MTEAIMPRPTVAPSPGRPWLVDSVFLALCAALTAAAVILELADWPGITMSLRGGTDMEIYLRHANGLLDGTWPDPEPFFRAPLYPYLLAPLVAWGGQLLAVLMLQALLLVGTVLTVYHAARLEAGRLAGYLAALGLLFYGGYLYFVAVLHSTLLEVFLVASTLLLVALLRRARRDGSAAPRVFAWAAAVGASYALLCLVRPNFLAVSPFLALGLLLERPRQWRRGLLIVAVIAAVSGAPVLGVVYRNNLYSDHFVTLTTNAPATFLPANSEGSLIFNFSSRTGPPLSPVSGAFWKHQLRKALGYWWSVEVPQNTSFYLFRDQALMLKLAAIPWALLAAVFLVGLWVLGRDLGRWWPLLVFFGVYYLTVIAFYVIGRYRLPGVPPMLILGAVALCRLRDWWPRRRVAVIAVAAAAVVLILLMQPWDDMRREQDLTNVAFCCLLHGRPDQAESYLTEALERGGSRQAVRLQAVALAWQGKFAPALEMLAVLEQREPRNIDYRLSRVAILELMGRREDAAALRAATDRQRYPEGEFVEMVGEGIMWFREEAGKQPPVPALRSVRMPGAPTPRP